MGPKGGGFEGLWGGSLGGLVAGKGIVGGALWLRVGGPLGPPRQDLSYSTLPRFYRDLIYSYFAEPNVGQTGRIAYSKYCNSTIILDWLCTDDGSWVHTAPRRARKLPRNPTESIS